MRKNPLVVIALLSLLFVGSRSVAQAQEPFETIKLKTALQIAECYQENAGAICKTEFEDFNSTQIELKAEAPASIPTGEANFVREKAGYIIEVRLAVTKLKFTPENPYHLSWLWRAYPSQQNPEAFPWKSIGSMMVKDPSQIPNTRWMAPQIRDGEMWIETDVYLKTAN